MGYDVRRKIAKQWSSLMGEEEEDVWVSLKEAGYTYISFVTKGVEGRPLVTDFTPTKELYGTYIRHRNRFRGTYGEDLTIQQFGVAFNAVTEETLMKTRRRIVVDGRKKLVWGYLGVKGPASVTIRIRRGRPPLQ